MCTRDSSIRARVHKVSNTLLDDLAVDLLASEPRPGISSDHFVEKRRRQICGIGLRRCARDRRAWVSEEPFDQGDWTRCRGDELARPPPQPEAELQHVKSIIDVPPLGQLVAPGGVELRSTQLFGVLR